MIKKATKVMVDLAKFEMEAAKRTLDANDSIWMAEWNSMPNPFAAVAWYLSKEQRTRREPFISAWTAARDKYDAIKPKKREREIS